MKRLLSIALALSLAGTSAAFANPGKYRDSRSNHYGYSQSYRQQSRDNTAAAVGLGLFALGVIGIIASQQRNNDYGYYAPAPAPAYGYGGNGYQGYQGTPNGYYGSGYNNYGSYPYRYR